MRFAVLVDGGFLSKALRDARRPRRTPTSDEIVDACRRVQQHSELQDHELLRILYYDAPPATGTITNPLSGEKINLGQTKQHALRQALLHKIESSPNFALRQGELATRGWVVRPASLAALSRRRPSNPTLRAKDLQPSFQQKGVDLRIGLDIARLSPRRLVDAIVVVAGDSDFIPAFKFAGREGLRVYLEDLGSKFVKRELRAHADVVLGTVFCDPQAGQAGAPAPQG